MVVKAALIAGMVALAGTASAGDPEQDVKRLVPFIQKNQYGYSSDQWIEKYNFSGQWEKVGLVFGFMDDYEFCDDIIKLYMTK